jgi:hypothetical protein
VSPASRARLTALFDPVLDAVSERASIAETFIDKDLYRIMVATLWANVVLDPAELGLLEDDLEDAHDLVNERIVGVLGADQDIRSCYAFLNSRAGERAMQAARLTQEHKDLLTYFASMILDPEGHRRWMASLSDPRGR